MSDVGMTRAFAGSRLLFRPREQLRDAMTWLRRLSGRDFLVLVPLGLAILLFTLVLLPALPGGKGVFTVSNLHLPNCHVSSKCETPKERIALNDFCAHHGYVCKDAANGNQELNCKDTAECKTAVRASQSEVESISGMLNTYFIGLCAAIGLIYKGVLEKGFRPRRFQLVSFIGFSISAYSAIFFTYWVRASIARQLTDRLDYVTALALDPLHLAELQTVATIVTALATTSAILCVAVPEKEKFDAADLVL